MEGYNAQPRPSMLRPVVIGGIISGIVSLMPGFWCCDVCCLWYIIGAIVAVLMYKGMAFDDVTPGQGALLGLLTWVIGVVIFVVFVIVLLSVFHADTKFDAYWNDILNQVEQQMSQGGAQYDAEQERGMGEVMGLMRAITFAQALTSIGFVWFMNLIGAVVAGTITAAAAGKVRHRYDEPPPYQLPN